MTNNYEQPKYVCLYHGIDLDGFCSGAIYRKWAWDHNHDAEIIPIHYGWKIPWEKLENAHVTMVDFTIQPWEDFQKLMRIAKSVKVIVGKTHIDHHDTAIQMFNQHEKELENNNVKMILDNTQAGCELTWNYYKISYHDSKKMPSGIYLLGRYDVWDHVDTRTLPFQYAMRVLDADPLSDNWRLVWDKIFTDDQRFVNDMVEKGSFVLQYQQKQDAQSAQRICFPVRFMGQQWLAANTNNRGSKFFDSQRNDEQYVGLISFHWDGNLWNIGLYSSNGNIHCGNIAQKYGGGGHKSSAGIRLKELPFRI